MLLNPLLQVVLLFALVVAGGLFLTGLNDFVARLRQGQQRKRRQRTLVVAALPAPSPVQHRSDAPDFKVLTVRTRASTPNEAEFPRAA